MKLTIFGYLCRDRNTVEGGGVHEIVGGKGLFAAAAAAQSGIEVELITWLPSTDLELLDALQSYPVTSHVIPIPTGTVNTNSHSGDIAIATTKLDPYSLGIHDVTEDMRQAIMTSDMVLLMPDIEGKIAPELIQYMSDTLGVTLAADIGKYFRTLQPDGTLEPRYPWPGQADLLKYLNIVFVSVEDIAPALERGESLLSVARQMTEQGPTEVVITQGSKGASVFHRETNELIDIAPHPATKVVEPTGAGDTFIAAYCAEHLLTDSIHEAGRFAAVAASFKLAYPGPLREHREAIEQALVERPPV